MNAFVAHANRDVFGPDAGEFRPERWLGQEESVMQMDQYFLSVSQTSSLTRDLVFLIVSMHLKSAEADNYVRPPFGRGPRTCIGKKIALLMLNTLIPELVLRFDLEPMNPEREWTVYNDTFMYQEGFRVEVREAHRGR